MPLVPPEAVETLPAEVAPVDAPSVDVEVVVVSPPEPTLPALGAPSDVLTVVAACPPAVLPPTSFPIAPVEPEPASEPEPAQPKKGKHAIEATKEIRELRIGERPGVGQFELPTHA